MKTVPLHGNKAAGRVALVDDEDYDLVMQHRWSVYYALGRPGRRPRGPYAVTKLLVNGRWTTVYMHKLITGYVQTDHKNHNGLDNQRSNLREATHAQNAQNGRPQIGRSSCYKGVNWYRRRGKWVASIRVNGNLLHLGYFDSEIAAALVYNAAAQEAFGVYAYLNEIPEAA